MTVFGVQLTSRHAATLIAAAASVVEHLNTRASGFFRDEVKTRRGLGRVYERTGRMEAARTEIDEAKRFEAAGYSDGGSGAETLKAKK